MKKKISLLVSDLTVIIQSCTVLRNTKDLIKKIESENYYLKS